MRLQNSRVIIYILLVVACLNNTACYQGRKTMEPLIASQEDKTIIELSSTVYDNNQLTEIMAFNGSLFDLHQRYPVECIRRRDNIQRVSFLGKDSVLILSYDASGSLIVGNIYPIEKYKVDFDSFQAGQPLSEVLTLDPNGTYLFLNTGRNDVPRQSRHYTRDGFIVTFTYDNANMIVSIEYEII